MIDPENGVLGAASYAGSGATRRPRIIDPQVELQREVVTEGLVLWIDVDSRNGRDRVVIVHGESHAASDSVRGIWRSRNPRSRAVENVRGGAIIERPVRGVIWDAIRGAPEQIPVRG